ncbi:MAG: Trm112 family protein [Candidatus Omnitrophota bacterium]|nr:Trm112 family protein [Candidatus Desulfofervidus auxilii]RKY40508.1 MAG: Trm112 family protein [Candidatus Omnitrophota bacterium]
MPISSELLNILACPKCKGNLRYVKQSPHGEGLICDKCKLFYPIKENIPIMLIEEAIKIERSETI